MILVYIFWLFVRPFCLRNLGAVDLNPRSPRLKTTLKVSDTNLGRSVVVSLFLSIDEILGKILKACEAKDVGRHET